MVPCWHTELAWTPHIDATAAIAAAAMVAAEAECPVMPPPKNRCFWWEDSHGLGIHLRISAEKTTVMGLAVPAMPQREGT